MFHNTHAHFVLSTAGFTIAALVLWCGLAQPLAAQHASALVNASSPIANTFVAGNVTTKTTDSTAPAPPVHEVNEVAYPRPPIACKVGAKGVLTDCHINEGYNLNDVANWFQDDHDRTLQLAVNSVTLAKKFEHSLESCAEEKGKK